MVKTPGFSGAPAPSVRQIEHAGAGQALPAAQVVVEEQAERAASRPAAGPLMRQHEAQRPHDVRRDAPQHLALGQRLAHQPEIVVLEVAQAAVDQLGGARRGAAGEVAHLAQEHGQAAAGSVAGDAAAVDAATDDGQVEDLLSRTCSSPMRGLFPTIGRRAANGQFYFACN